MSELGVLSHLLRQQISLSYIYANVHGIDVGLAGRILTEPSSSELLMSIIFFLKYGLPCTKILRDSSVSDPGQGSKCSTKVGLHVCGHV